MLDDKVRIIEDTQSNLPTKLVDVTKRFLVDDNRSYFGQAAVSLENQLHDPKKMVR